MADALGRTEQPRPSVTEQCTSSHGTTSNHWHDLNLTFHSAVRWTNFDSNPSEAVEVRRRDDASIMMERLEEARSSLVKAGSPLQLQAPAECCRNVDLCAVFYTPTLRPGAWERQAERT